MEEVEGDDRMNVRRFSCIECGQKGTIREKFMRMPDTPYYRCKPCHRLKCGEVKEVHRQSYVNVNCLKCGVEYEVCLSIYNRKDFKARCGECRRDDKRKYSRERMRRVFGYNPRKVVE